MNTKAWKEQLASSIRSRTNSKENKENLQYEISEKDDESLPRTKSMRQNSVDTEQEAIPLRPLTSLKDRTNTTKSKVKKKPSYSLIKSKKLLKYT